MRRVNLLDPSEEPTDEDLQELAQDVLCTVRERAAAANAALTETIRAETLEAMRRLHSRQLPIASAEKAPVQAVLFDDAKKGARDDAP
jgi:hypothetical protein